MLQESMQQNTPRAALEFWPYWFLQIIRKHRRSYSLKVHSQLEYGDVVVGWHQAGAATEPWTLDEIILLLGDNKPSAEEWHDLFGTKGIEEPRALRLSEVQSAGMMIVVQERHHSGRLLGTLRPLTRDTYTAMGWMGRALAQGESPEMRRN